MSDIADTGDKRLHVAPPERQRLLEAKLAAVAHPTQRPADLVSRAGNGRLDTRRDSIDAREAIHRLDANADANARVERQLRASDDLQAARAQHVELRLSQASWERLRGELDAIDARYAANPYNTKAVGDRGEAIARSTIMEHGLPDDDGVWQPVDAVVSGQYDRVHGIDLVAVQAGTPVLIEVKHTRAVVLSDRPLMAFGSEAEQESYKQMGDGWTRDRWRKLIADPNEALELDDAGVHSEYLDPASVESERSRLWDDLLTNKRIVIVSPDGTDAVSSRLVRQCRERAIRPRHILTIIT